MGTTSTSGWAVFWFLAGFTALGTMGLGTGKLGLAGGAAMIGYSAVLFKSARPKEEI